MTPIIQAVLKRYGVQREALDAPGRSTRGVSEARAICCWIAKDLTSLTDIEIGAHFKKTRSFVPLAVRRIDRQRRKDKWLRDNTDQLLAELRAELRA